MEECVTNRAFPDDMHRRVCNGHVNRTPRCVPHASFSARARNENRESGDQVLHNTPHDASILHPSPHILFAPRNYRLITITKKKNFQLISLNIETIIRDEREEF